MAAQNGAESPSKTASRQQTSRTRAPSGEYYSVSGTPEEGGHVCTSREEGEDRVGRERLLRDWTPGALQTPALRA
ncbi:hypothetical protein NDU88_006417 [Pleurodeles waltl]|uniref:Uncharacterized protein n=1 Tax=Pleurodeles waltl TaxID=8319 RepID=A0AAV7UME3_PLEWA|nr:hypothetical protein NDU88_006417 [Pleurodeles waltl]